MIPGWKRGWDRARCLLRDACAVDLRSLAAARVALGLILLWDLASRARSLEDHYTDFGVFPRGELMREAGSWAFSVHAAGGSWQYEAFLFALSCVLAAMFAAGMLTRLSGLASWALLLSLHGRTPPVFHTADLYLRILLLWIILLPCGARWSLDALRSGGRFPTASGGGTSSRYRSVGRGGADGPGSMWSDPASAGLLSQVALVYICTALYKTGSLRYWWTDGSMLGYTLRLEIYATPFGTGLVRFTEPLRWLTRGVFALELVGPFVALAAFSAPRLRAAAVAAFCLLHLGMSACMELGLFPWVSIAGWLVFLPGRFWDRLVGAGRPAVDRAITPGSVTEPYGEEMPPPNPLQGGPPPHAVRSAAPAHGLPRWLRPAAACLVLLNVWMNAAGLAPRGVPALPSAALAFMDRIGFVQRWSMFSAPGTEDGWVVVPGRFADGKTLDLLTGRAVTWERPQHLSRVFPSDRWRTYMFRITSSVYSDERAAFARHLCRKWNSSQSPRQGRLSRLDIYYMRIPIKIREGVPVGKLGPMRQHRYAAVCADG